MTGTSRTTPGGRLRRPGSVTPSPAKDTPPLTFKPVTASNWNDLENLFESRGGPSYCWCMVWRNMKKGASRKNKAAKKSSLRDLVDRHIPIGILAYAGPEPVAWCSVAPRESYRELSGDATLDGVWSIVCFYAKREYRAGGITEKLVSAAAGYAAKRGAAYLEAYPVDPDSPSYGFMGHRSTFERLGFVKKGRAGTRRNVMVLNLKRSIVS